MKILMVSPCPMHPPNQGNRARIRNLYQAIQAAGHKVDFLNIKMENGDYDRDRDFVGEAYYHALDFTYNAALPSIIRRLIKRFTDRQFLFYVNNALDDYCDKKTVDYVKALDAVNHYDVIWVEYIFLSRIFEYFGQDKLKILDTHDRFTDRYKLYIKDHKPYRWFSVSEEDEKKALMRADVVVAIQEEEGDIFKRVMGDQRSVRVIGHQTELKQMPLVNPKAMLFLASGNPLNIRTINYFVEEIMPMVRSEIHDAKLIIAGSVCQHLHWEDDGIKTIGPVDTLEGAYGMADIVINPIKWGTGLKIKCVEALAYRRVLVTSSNGAAGLDSDNNNHFIIADEPEAFAKAIIHLMTDEAQRIQIADSGYAYVRQLNEAISREIESVLSFRESY